VENGQGAANKETENIRDNIKEVNKVRIRRTKDGIMNEGRETPQNKTIKEYISTKKESGK
jgi:hypothetical protein